VSGAGLTDFLWLANASCPGIEILHLALCELLLLGGKGEGEVGGRADASIADENYIYEDAFKLLIDFVRCSKLKKKTTFGI